VRKINDAHHAEDQVQPARHERVDAAEQDSADQQLGHRHDVSPAKREDTARSMADGMHRVASVASNVIAGRVMTTAIVAAFPCFYCPDNLPAMKSQPS
jgi:hypothetical protein